MVDLVKSTSPRELIARGAPKLFLTSAKDWKEKLVAWFETDPQGPRRKLYPAQVEQVLIDLLSYGFSLLGREAQFASEQRWLLFAVGQHLDVAAANNSTFRLKAQPATCRVRATLSAPALAQTLTGKAGDTPAAGTVVFRLDSAIVIAAGQTAGEAIATAQVPGVTGNGFLPGQVRGQIRLPGSGATGGAAASGLGNADLVNISETAGGTEEEGDEALRERAMNAHERISKAGPRESYRQQARAYSPAIADVAVIRPAPGQIHLYVLMSDGVLRRHLSGRAEELARSAAKAAAGRCPVCLCRRGCHLFDLRDGPGRWRAERGAKPAGSQAHGSRRHLVTQARRLHGPVRADLCRACR
ncbi:baseplate J/gp47 family protein [Pannonibacter sp. SL95]|uniref:baseplate J/gp47 family protein n=1 Tax=Pannonibacter sp. SL95 TaxID=2995153 RepID=UPI0022756CFA|nr:baseplate J/gp47 family protein [Pannonibacter sp. SL95]MCY1704457.1 baseplate J/gp47 family protein [Pannonibacter sp. SL95]